MIFAFRATAALLLSTGLCTSAMAGPPPTRLTSAGLQAAQTRHYGANSRAVFNSVIAALQSMGYVDINANRDAGTVSAVTDAKAKTILNVFWGFGKKKWTQKASVFVEDVGSTTTVRLNLMVSETKSRGIFGTSFTDGQLVQVADPYLDFFHALDGEVAQRGGAMSATVGMATSASIVPSAGGLRLVPARTASGFCVEAPAGYQGTGAANAPAITSAQPLCH